jgi:hypothetical protein
VEGSFEYALNEILEEQLDLSVFDHRYRNDETGRSAYDPKVFARPATPWHACHGLQNSETGF